ncbi:MAG: pyrroline-5-carboxylate reductase [Firmicutes bacterium]|nr:pyrroline-5-carboxylate reductase [Bacillota bacterium]
MAEAMLRGLVQSGARLLASDPDPARREKIEAALGVEVIPDNTELVRRVQVVVLAVKPQVAPAVLEEIGSSLRPGQSLLSIVAGLRLMTMARFLPAGVASIRAMPNTPALIGEGITAVATEAGGEMEELARAILAPLGRVIFLPEVLLDAVTGLSGSGPAYVALFAEALIEGGVKVGLPRPVARELAVQTLLGTARMLAAGEPPGALRERVTSPGGTTAYGLLALERGGLRATVIEAISAATARAVELGLLTEKGTEG